jgi:hypothetical protein
VVAEANCLLGGSPICDVKDWCTAGTELLVTIRVKFVVIEPVESAAASVMIDSPTLVAAGVPWKASEGVFHDSQDGKPEGV